MQELPGMKPQPVTKILRQLYETQFTRVFAQKLKDISIKTPPSPASMLWVSNLSTVWSWCNFQAHQHLSKGEREKPLQKVAVLIYFVTGCLNFLTFKIKYLKEEAK